MNTDSLRQELANLFMSRPESSMVISNQWLPILEDFIATKVQEARWFENYIRDSIPKKYHDGQWRDVTIRIKIHPEDGLQALKDKGTV